MGVVLTHGITHDTGTFSMGLIRTVIQLYHGIENTPLNRLQAISDIRKRTGCNNAHGIVDIGFLHGFFQIDFMNFIKNIIFHCLLTLRFCSFAIRYPGS